MKKYVIAIMSAVLSPLFFFAQTSPEPIINSTLTGKVIDGKTKVALSGATVHIKGTTHEVLTDNNGGFHFVTGQKLPYILIISFVGYQTLEIQADSKSIEIPLEEKHSQLNEVVVVGYGTQRKKDLTGSVASVPGVVLKQTPVTSFDKALQGTIPGVQVTQSSGQPGASATIRIRGGNSINGGNEPLYVIDGFPIYNDNADINPGALSGGKLNALSTINTSDIESIEVLKDASATAIYGSRGANGVVIITTKRGKAGTHLISYDGYYGTQSITKKIPVLNAKQWAEFSNDAFVNAGKPAPYTDAQIQAFGEGTNWQNESFRTAPMQSHQISATGGDDKTQYSISGNYFGQDGILLNTNFSRLSGRVNVDRKLTDNLKAGISFTGSRVKSNISPESTVRDVLSLNPTVPLIDSTTGTYKVFDGATGSPVATLKNVTNQSNVNRYISNIYVEYNFLKNFVARVTFGTDYIGTKQNNYYPRTTYTGLAVSGDGSIGTQNGNTWLNENTLSYKKSFNKHSLNVLAGYTYQASSTEGVTARSQNFPNDDLTYSGLNSGTVSFLPVPNKSDWKLASYLGRINYSFDSKYLFTLSGRADGSSKFGKNNKWAFFPSAAFAWNVSDEKFLQNVHEISNLKLRASAGITGNQQIGQYQSLAQLNPYSYIFADNLATGFAPSRIANPNLGWESTAQYDLGVDAALFNNRVSLTADFYYKKTNDLLLDMPVPETSGFYTSLQNIGTVENKGLEILLNTENFRGKFQWNTTVTFAINRNKVLDLGGVSYFLPDGGTERNIKNPTIVQVGKPVGQFYGYRTNGILQLKDDISKIPTASGFNKPGDQRFVDINNDGKINSDSDRVVLGTAQPKFIGGFTNVFNYKGFDLLVFIQGSYGNSILNYNKADLETYTGLREVGTDALNRWTPTNPTNDVPRANNSQSALLLSDRFVEDGSYLRLKNIVFGYSLPAAVLNKLHLKKLRVYVSAQNIATLTSYSGFDPEVSRQEQSTLYSGIDYGNYPNAKSFLVGLNLSF